MSGSLYCVRCLCGVTLMMPAEKKPDNKRLALHGWRHEWREQPLYRAKCKMLLCPECLAKPEKEE